MKKSISIIISMFLLIITAQPTFSQELTSVASKDYYLSENFPNPNYSRGYYTSKERGDVVKVGDTITIYAFHKSMDWTFVYNQRKTGYIWGIKASDKQLYKQIKKAKVLDYHENAAEIKIKQQQIYSTIVLLMPTTERYLLRTLWKKGRNSLQIQFRREKDLFVIQ